MRLPRFAAFVAAALLALVVAPASAYASDLAVTAASVLPASNAVLNTGTAGEALTAGVATVGAAAGQPVVVQRSGSITIGATLTAGTVYYLSGTAGGIRPAADNTTGDYPQAVGIATSTTLLKLSFVLSAGVAL